MGTYQHSSKQLLHKAVYIIVALGLVIGGYFTYKASQTSTEDRSKAALEYKIYRQWEFEGTDTEGWMGLNLTNVKVGDHLLKGIVGGRKEYPKLLHNLISLDKGNKVFEISVLVAPAWKPVVGATPRVEQYMLNVLYGKVDDRGKRRQLVITGKTDGQLHNFTAKFPEIGSLDIDNLALEFVNVKSDSTIAVDWIRITDRIGTKISITPKPTCIPLHCAAPPGGCSWVGGDGCSTCGKLVCETTPTPTPGIIDGVACAQDVKMCPDGSSVGRIPPSCEFAPCPPPTTPKP